MFLYRLRWTLVDCMSVGSDHPLDLWSIMGGGEAMIYLDNLF